jgi:hypothetical protein
VLIGGRLAGARTGLINRGYLGGYGVRFSRPPHVNCNVKIRPSKLPGPATQMPLYENAEQLIRGNIAVIKRGQKPRAVVIGYLTEAQLHAINAYRSSRGWELIEKDIVFVGCHVYDSRVVRDGYTEDDLLAQIRSAFSETCKLIPTHKMTVLQNPKQRESGYGCRVRDELTLECSARFPRSELCSVVPRGDKNHKPIKLKEAALVASSVIR